jgi:hypothetical protein
MKDKQTLFSMIDALTPYELEEVYQHVKQRRQIVSFRTATGAHHTVSDSSREPAETIRAEVNAIIDEVLNSVRHKHEAQESKATTDQYAMHR